MASPYRSVPDSFAEFSATRVTKLTDAELLASGPYGCRGCGAHAAVGYLDYLDAPHEMLCEGCLRYHLGYEQAEERNVRLILSSAVAGALAAGAPQAMIRVAFEDALRDLVRIDADPSN